MFWKNKGILGINARNLLYIRPYNKKKAIKLADDKIKTKQFLSARGIPVPKLYSIIRKHEDLEKFDFGTLPSSFVLKPNNGFGGEGIIVVTNKKDNFWITAGGKRLNKSDLEEHISDILDGRFSISNVSDVAFFEQLIIQDDIVGKFSYKGLPDIRVVVHNLIPIMSMLRLPTKESDGKANLHMGAVGVGIDIAKGEATYISYKNRIIDEIPNGLGKIRGLKIPHWDQILHIASKVQLITNLGYLAADIAIDKHSGPVILEINARAGLGVQIANLAPLRKRLERIEGVKVNNPIKGVRIAKDMFGNTLEKEIAHLSGKQVINSQEEVEIIQKKGIFKINAQIDTGRERSVLDEATAIKMNLLDETENYDPLKSTLKIKFSLKEKRIQTIVDIERIPNEDFKIIIGNRDLSDFLISPNTKSSNKKLSEKEKNISSEPTQIKKNPKINYQKIDQDLLSIDNRLKMLYHLRPINLESEKQKFFQNPNYNPVFEYPQLKFNPLEFIDSLQKIECDDSPLGTIFTNKRAEILNKIHLLDSIGEEDFSIISKKLFGSPSEEDFKNCKAKIIELKIKNIKKEDAIYEAEFAKKRFEETFKKYKLDEWKVKIKESMVARCVAGKNNRLFIRAGAMFSREDIESLIVHEIETHILTAANGKMQNYEIFNRGLANYLITQEGLAMYNVEKQRHIPFSTNYKARSHVIAIYLGLKSSFSEIYHELKSLNIPDQDAFQSALKAKRGLINTKEPGAFTKDHIYYKGYQQITDFIKNGGKIADLYIGKLNIEDLETIKKIPGIQEPSLLPSWIKK